MEKNEFLLYNEIVYRVHARQTLEELIHSDPYCLPKSFAQVERSGSIQWIGVLPSAQPRPGIRGDPGQRAAGGIDRPPSTRDRYKRTRPTGGQVLFRVSVRAL